MIYFHKQLIKLVVEEEEKRSETLKRGRTKIRPPQKNRFKYFHTHLLIKIQSLVADRGAGGGRWPADSGQKLRFEGEHLQTPDAKRQEDAGSRDSLHNLRPTSQLNL